MATLESAVVCTEYSLSHLLPSFVRPSSRFVFKMPFDFSLFSDTSGEIFESTYDDLENQRTVPTTRLSKEHPFAALWREHLAELQTPGLYDSVIDAFVDISEGVIALRGPEAASAKRDDMRKLLVVNPPNVVVVSGFPDAYGYHFRLADLWPFICVADHYVALWQVAEENTEKKLSLLAVLKTTLDHEMGHWLFTLVSIGANQIWNATNPRY